MKDYIPVIVVALLTAFIVALDHKSNTADEPTPQPPLIETPDPCQFFSPEEMAEDTAYPELPWLDKGEQGAPGPAGVEAPQPPPVVESAPF